MRILLFLGLAVLAAAERRRFDGCEVWELTPHSKEDFYQVQILARQHQHENENELIFWDEPRNIDDEVHVMACSKGKEMLQGFLAAVDIQAKKLDIDFQRELDAVYASKDASTLDYDEDNYNTYEDIMAQLDVLQARCPSGVNCEVEQVGSSYEGRAIKMFRMTKPGSGRQGIFMDSLIHCREWLAGATNMGILSRLINEYGSNPDATRLVDTYDWHFLPVVNADGYAYTWSTERMWRKNRTPNQGSSCVGTDLNRNHNYMWGTTGSSTFECSETYRGATSGSEPEVQVLEAAGEALRGSLILWMTWHTNGQYYLYPFGTVESGSTRCMVSDDDEDLSRVAQAATSAIFDYSGSPWRAGSTCTLLYAASATTQDWAYGAGLAKYSYTPELRGPGFDPSPSAIAPSVEENWRAVVAMLNEIEAIEG